MSGLKTQQLKQQHRVAEADASQFLTFLVGDERFAIGILDVNEIIEVEEMTRVPMTPDFIRGVINLRGSVVPVIDLSARLGRGVSQLTKRSSIILVEIPSAENQQLLGMLVDEVNEIIDIDADHLQPPPNFGTEIRTDFIQAMGRVDDGFIILLSIAHVLSIEELSMIESLNPSDATPRWLDLGRALVKVFTNSGPNPNPILRSE